MRRSTFVAAVFLTFVSLTSGEDTSGNSDSLLLEAKSYINQGHFVEAEFCLKQFLRHHPNHDQALRWKEECDKNIVRVAANYETINLEFIRITGVKFEGATVEEVFSYLSWKAIELSDGKFGMNVVFGNPNDGKREVTMEVLDMPLLEVIRYVCQLSGMKERMEQFTITLY